VIVLCEEQRVLPLFTAVVALKTGSREDPPGKEGLAQHASELMRRGTAELSRSELDGRLDDLGASLDIGCSRDAVTFTGRCLSRHQEALLTLLCECLVRPTLAEPEHARLVRESLAMLDDLRDDDASLCQRYFHRYAMAGHPYGRPTMGTAASLSALTQDDAAKWVQRNVVPDSLILGFAGDLSQAQVAKLAARATTGLHTGSFASAPPAPLPTRRGRKTVVVDKPERDQSQILIGHDAPPPAAPDWLPLHVAATVFGGTFTSRLMQEVRVKRGWSYGADCRVGRGLGGHTFAIRVFPALEQTQGTLALVFSLWEELVQAGITKDELDFAKSYLQGNWAFELATPADRLERRLDSLLLEVPPPEDFIPRLQSVTLQSVNDALRRHMRPDDAVTVIVASAEELVEELSGLPIGPVEVVPYDSY
jgi:zinc protease